MSSALTRQVLQAPVREVVSHLDYMVDLQGSELFSMLLSAHHEFSPDSLAPEFRESLYNLLCDCCRDAEQWQQGYHCTTEALKRLPLSLRQGVWQQRVFFMSRLGMSMEVSLLSMKDKDPVQQAQVGSLARHTDATMR